MTDPRGSDHGCCNARWIQTTRGRGAGMSRKRPSRIRKDLEAARARVNTLIGVLQQNESEKRWGLGDECSKAIGFHTRPPKGVRRSARLKAARSNRRPSATAQGPSAGCRSRSPSRPWGAGDRRKRPGERPGSVGARLKSRAVRGRARRSRLPVPAVLKNPLENSA
jgi:hypothetical protein